MLLYAELDWMCMQAHTGIGPVFSMLFTATSFCKYCGESLLVFSSQLISYRPILIAAELDEPTNSVVAKAEGPTSPILKPVIE
jgi:hypothetical protein